MAAKTAFSKKDFDAILSHYNLGEYQGSESFAHGLGQTTALLLTTKGKFVLRYYENRSERHVLFEVRLLRYLRSKRYPVPAIIKNSSGGLLGRYNGKPFTIIEHVEGEHGKNPNISSHHKQLSEVVKAVAALHRLTKGYKATYMKDHQAYTAEYCLKQYKGADKGRKDWLRRELAALEFPSSLPKGVCHADLNYSNFLFKNGKITSVLDFDMSFHTFLVYDVASLIYWWAWPPGRELKVNEARYIVKEYAKWRALSADERRHIYDALKLIILLGISWSEEEDFEQEKKKIDYLNAIGREGFRDKLFN